MLQTHIQMKGEVFYQSAQLPPKHSELVFCHDRAHKHLRNLLTPTTHVKWKNTVLSQYWLLVQSNMHKGKGEKKFRLFVTLSVTQGVKQMKLLAPGGLQDSFNESKSPSHDYLMKAFPFT